MRLVALSSVALLLTGCATHQDLIEARAENERLLDENDRFARESAALRAQLDRYEAELVAAGQTQGAQPSYPELDRAGVGYEQRAGNLVLTLPSSITFASGKADLTEQGKNALRAIAGRLSSDFPDAEYWIEGHTDTDQPSRGAFDTNRALSIARAEAVHAYLVGSCRVPDDACVVAGHGEYRPVASNGSSDGKAKNRRVELVVRRPGG
ncbi:MAG TPA: OmpA family protein [Planctomycetota bacterium]|nr:OmpA family protein [Planctomycetota bacterium]